MGKIPKGLADKDMFRDYVEEETLESRFLQAEAAEDKRRKRQAQAEPKTNLSIAYLTPDLVKKLGRELLALKMALYQEGITSYSMKVKREGHNIVLSPQENKKRG